MGVCYLQCSAVHCRRCSLSKPTTLLKNWTQNYAVRSANFLLTSDFSLYQLRLLTLKEPSSPEMPCDIPRILTRRLPFLSVRSLACQRSFLHQQSPERAFCGCRHREVSREGQPVPCGSPHPVLCALHGPCHQRQCLGSEGKHMSLRVESRAQLLPFPAPMLSHHLPIMLMNNHRAGDVLDINPFSQL